ncbi:MAG: bifunctional 2-C-methyl-D-erythritol 4-phosphate cytidylyltransferase/2-C-methyl-D-erythritol 2,4-cyclodiphosphate synthase [Rhizobiaceae bacterium]|nr:bifunctional 2-C-methyl-D-erythritol 4-phosphate cytidylyltransferase/2-C-methyl-D-erythritol 2,4-cyclodiphosphate synthase [Rhizobiaceae bacterium]
MKNAAVIVAAGRGERIGGSGGPKQYRLLDDRCVLQHTINCFTAHPQIDVVQVVIHADDRELYASHVMHHDKLAGPVIGGATRQASCKAGVDALDAGTQNVLIHDAARPFVSAIVINNVLNGIAKNTCALPANAIADTIKRAGSDQVVLETVSRDDLFLAQTPQGFLLSEIGAAHEHAANESDTDFTDDAAVGEWAGMQVKLVKGDRDNFKITTQQDLEAARERMSGANMIADVRTGSGYDVHTLGPGDGVILCGIKIPHTQSLQGHSDADVGLHALTDALLGTIGAGDIGSHFPPSDPKWKGAASDQFLAHAVQTVQHAGGTITNLDVTIVCEAPKVGPHRDPMRNRVAEICGIADLSRVSVKATTNEKIGFIGREEGIAALATATVCFQGTKDV